MSSGQHGNDLSPSLLPGSEFRDFLVALAAFTGGYALQFAGHWVDGTESGEMRWIKRQTRKMLGRDDP